MPPRFLNSPVDTQLQWPRKEAVVDFGNREIVVFPPSKDHDPSLHIDLVGTRLPDVEAASVLSQFLSIAVWLDDTFAVLLAGWSGNPVPVRPARQTSCWPSSILDTWCNAWQPVADVKARRALAIYREAVNMEHFHSLPYAVLGYYKIIESAYPDGPKRKRQLEQEVSDLLAKDRINIAQLKQIGFDQNRSPEKIAAFLWEGGRHAVAHAKNDPTINPDDFNQLVALRVIRRAAIFLDAIGITADKGRPGG
jgi:hypothetical protein